MLVATDTLTTPLLRTISKAIATDPEGGLELIRLSLFEAMCDLADTYGPRIRADITKAAQDSRSQLVRSYITKRLAGEDTTSLLASAEAAGRISKEEDDETRRHASASQPRDHGKWASASAAGKVDLIRAHTKGALGQLGDGPIDEKNGYQKLAATGRALTYVSALSGNQAGLAVGAVAQLAGEIGPQAETVLGPSVKRTAYRYRGTEKKPGGRVQASAHQLGVIAQKLGDGKALTASEQQTVVRWEQDAKSPPRRTDGETPLPSDPAAAVFASVMAGAQGKSGDELRLEATSQYLAGSLQGRIPSLHHAKISLQAGKMPPSIGYLIDSDGDVVSEAQGFNGDHYLPFDLKNLGALHGGSYVRTRTTGGPTDEDIYTGLMMGARQVTVVSHSGVFTVAFDKDVRGGRRYSDKARQMVDRYAALLEQINSGQHMEVPFDKATERRLREKAIAGAPRNPQMQRQLLEQYKAEERDELTFADDDELDRQAVDNVVSEYKRGDLSGVSSQVAQRDVEDERHHLRTERDEAQARAYRLDGVGYEAALVALQQEFPFYMQPPQYETWKEYTSARKLQPQAVRGKAGQLGGKRSGDIGYTRQGGLIPVKAPQAKNKTAVAEKPVEGAAAAEPTVAAVQQAAPSSAPVGETEIRASGITDTVARSAGEAALLVHNVEGADPATENATDATALLDTSPTGYLNYVVGTYQNPRAIAQWLMAPTTDARHITKLRDSLGDLQKRVNRTEVHADYPPEFWEEAHQDLTNIVMLKEPYAKANGPDPVLDVADKPQAFSDVPRDYTGFGAYQAYLAQNPGVMAQFLDISDKQDPAIAKDISAEVSRYEQMRGAGERIKTNGGMTEGIGIPAGMDAGEAVDVAEQGQSHPLYQEISDKQKAWSVLRGMDITHILTGATPPEINSDAAPKAREYDTEVYQANPFAKTPVTKRARVVVHRAGSPASLALSKRLASPSPQRARLVPVSR